MRRVALAALLLLAGCSRSEVQPYLLCSLEATSAEVSVHGSSGNGKSSFAQIPHEALSPPSIRLDLTPGGKDFSARLSYVAAGTTVATVMKLTGHWSPKDTAARPAAFDASAPNGVSFTGLIAMPDAKSSLVMTWHGEPTTISRFEGTCA